MKAVGIAAWGATPTVVAVTEPRPGPGEALVELRAAGLNPVDLAIAAGRFYGSTPDPPFVLGAEAVGVVVESERMPVGTRVWALVTTGAFGEVFTAPEAELVPVPDGIDDVTAAAIGVAGLAGWMSVLDRGALAVGERVLVLGGSGVVGQVAIQAAAHGGAGRIVAVARTRQGRDRAMALGAHAFVALDDDADLGGELRAACDPGADLVIDMLWGGPLQAALGAGAPRARFVQVGNAAGATATITGGALRGGRYDLRGFSVFTERPTDRASAYRRLAEAVASGAVVLQVEAVPLAEAPIAWARQAHGTAGRKLVLVV